jgi:quercetin dioxygenase-like cupin family protein
MPELVVRRKFPSPVDRQAIARDWRQRGFSCDLFVDPPGREWIDFVHAENELVTVLDGKLELTVSGETVVAGEGDEVFIPRNAHHSVRNVNDRTTYWLYGYD